MIGCHCTKPTKAEYQRISVVGYQKGRDYQNVCDAQLSWIALHLESSVLSVYSQFVPLFIHVYTV